MELLAQELRYGYAADLVVLDGIDLTLKSGCLTMVIGPNGTGKSTLIRILAGLVAPWSGAIGLNSGTGPLQDLVLMNPRERARNVAYLPQRVAEAEGYRVEQIVALGRFPHQNWWSLPSPEDEQIISAALADVDAAHLAGRFFSELSGGEQQMVLLAGILAQRSRILLLDEPGASLDIHRQAILFRKLKQMACADKAICCVTHELNMAAQFADQIYLMDGGRVSCSGTANEVLTPERLRHSYGEDVRVIQDPSSGRPIVVPCAGGRND